MKISRNPPYPIPPVAIPERLLDLGVLSLRHLRINRQPTKDETP
jgi:hypothetical protein